eukprot:4681408-Karenia_brevis.AAC.1
MGEILHQGEGKFDKEKVTMDPAVCAHPHDDLVRRGSGKQLWWTCKLCLRRWERLPLSKFEPTGAVTEGADLVTFGKHMGMTYNQSWQED